MLTSVEDCGDLISLAEISLRHHRLRRYPDVGLLDSSWNRPVGLANEDRLHIRSPDLMGQSPRRLAIGWTIETSGHTRRNVVMTSPHQRLEIRKKVSANRIRVTAPRNLDASDRLDNEVGSFG